MRELTGRELVWRTDFSIALTRTGTADFWLFDGGEPTAVTAKVAYERRRFFEVVMGAGDGIYRAHMDLKTPFRPSAAWKEGQESDLASFEVTTEGSFTCVGSISTASGRQFRLEPTHKIGYEYTVCPPGGAKLLTLSAGLNGAIGGNPGHMSISPEFSGDAEMPLLVTMAFAIANEQIRLLHRDAPPYLFPRAR